jgi:spore maturation protein CgeB
MKQRVAWSDAYTNALTSLGHTGEEIVANAPLLQQSWCQENHFKWENEKETIIHQLQQSKPDVVWLQDSYSFNGDFVLRIKHDVPSIKLVIGNCCFPIPQQLFPSFKVFDFITVCAPYFKTLLESNGLPECLILPHAFDKRILEEVRKPAKPKYDFLFSGSIIQDQNFHTDRITFLEELAELDIHLKLLVNKNNKTQRHIHLKQIVFLVTRFLRALNLEIVNQKCPLLSKINMLDHFPKPLKITKQLSNLIQDPVFGIEMFKQTQNSKIAFNIHGNIASDFAANMRMYEITGIGTCLLTDWKKDINLYFKEGEEILTYRSFEEAKEKINWLLAHPKEMQAIAQKGQQRTLKEHSYNRRAEKLASKIVTYLS